MTKEFHFKLFNRQIYFALITSSIATFFLFFTDEGVYNLNWMLKPNEWIGFCFFTSALFIPQVILILIFNMIDNGRYTKYLQLAIAAIFFVCACLLLIK